MASPHRDYDQIAASTLASRMKPRPVGPVSLLALGVNGIVGVGIFFVPADLARRAPGMGSVLVFAATALALLPVALCFAVLGRRYDRDGGPVVYARAAFGGLASFLVGWVTYVSAIASAAAVTAGLTGALLSESRPSIHGFAAAALATVLAAVAAAGIVISARAWTTLTALKLLPLAALVVLAVILVLRPGLHVAPASAAGPPSWLAAALLAMFALQGFEIVPVIAGHVRSPERAIPLATVGSLALAAALYVVLQAACVRALPGLSTSPAPLVDLAGVLSGPLFSRVVAAGTTLSALGIAFAMMVTTPRYLSALAEGGQLAFGLDAMSARGVPARALFVTWALVSLLLQTGDRAQLFALSSVAVLIQYGVTAASLAVLARRGERGLSSRHAILAAPALAVALALGAGATRREAIVAAGAILLGLALRASASRGRRTPSAAPGPTGRP
jgi:APA family basic amino acid/polyamine antiporter